MRTYGEVIRARARPMRRAAKWSMTLVVVAVATSWGSVAVAGPPDLRTGFYDPTASTGARDHPENEISEQLAYKRAHVAGATIVRLPLYWDRVAPDIPVKPPTFDASDPSSPFYNWVDFDLKVKTALANGLQPLVVISVAPQWADRGGPGPVGTNRPNLAEFAAFAKAASRRYSGSFNPGIGVLPRVRYWQVWNEPNNGFYLQPQFDSAGHPASPAMYRSMVNVFSTAVKEVRANNLVVAGGTSPFGRAGTVAPKTFARRVLCLNGNNRSSCSERTRFDIWAHHPYTHGGPTHSAYRKNDASLGDLPEIQQILRAGRGHIAAPRRPQFWVTELSWDTNPPDKRGVPVRMHARWVSEALYRSWKAGVNVVIWTQLRDYAWPRFAYQGGLYYHGGIGGLSDRPKPGLYAFRFPFVAFKRSGGVYVWGRVPLGKPARLAIETKTRRGWTRVATARTNAHGVLEKTIRTRFQAGTFRARRVGRGAHSYQYKIGPTRDIPYAALGCGGPIAC